MFSVALLGVAAVVTLALGAIVFLQYNRQAMHRHFAWLSFGIAGWIASNALFARVPEDESRFLMGLVSYGFAAFLALHFFLFCQAISVKKYSPRVVLGAKVVGAATTILSMVPGVVAYGVDGLSIDTRTLGLLAYGLVLVLLLGGGLRLLVISVGLARSKPQRSRILSVLIGLSAAAAIGAVCNLILPLLDNYSLTQYGPLGSVALVVICAYSMVRHGLFDIKATAIRSLAYGFSVATLAGVYYLVAYLVSLALFRSEASQAVSISPVNILLALLLAFMFQPVKRFFDRETDRIFYRNRYNTNDFLIRIGRILTSTTELHVVLEKVDEEIRQTLKASGSLFMVYRDNHPNELVGETINKRFSADDLAHIDAAATLHKGSLLIVDLLKSSDNPDEVQAYEVLSKRKVALVLPLISADEAIGYFMLGEHRAGGYSEQDITALEAIANELVIAVQNARSIQALRDLNASLEERVDDATKELRKSNEQLRQADEAKDEFVSMASHQLRTPLTSIKGYISMVLDGDAGEITPMQSKLLEEAFTSSERMVHLISDFLNVSRLQTGKFVLDRSLVNLADLVDEEVDGLKATASSRLLKLQYRKPSRFPSLYIDDSKIQQVVMNFIDNAIYYSAEGTTITVRTAVEEGNAIFEVHDTGIGVPEEEQARLFTKFFRATNARKQRPDGTGIGLFLAKKVITSHGGSMIFESVEGEGSTFGFRLPIKKLSEPPKAAEAEV